MANTTVFCVLWSIAIQVTAGELILGNGDRIEGELIAINKDKVTWKSPNFNQVEIPKSSVRKLTSQVVLKIRGEKMPCLIKNMTDETLSYQCKGQEQKNVSVHHVEDVVLFDVHKFLHFYEGKFSVTGSQSGGNKVEQDWVVDTDVLFRFADYRHGMGLRYEGNSAAKDAPMLEEYFALYAFDWFFSAKTYWLNRFEVLSDEVRKIKEQYTFGTGLGYQFWEAEKSAFAIETGADYVKEAIDISESEDLTRNREEYSSLRLAADYRMRLPLKIDLSSKTQMSQSLNDSEKWDVESKTGIGLPIASGISASITFEYSYDNLPAAEALKIDRTLRFGLSYAW